MKFSRKLCWLVVLWLAPFALFAATIEAQVDRNPVGIDESFQLLFKSSNDVDGDPDFSPLEPLVDILNTAQSSNISIINGRYESNKSWTLTLMPKKRGKLILPSISFGKDKSAPVEMIVKGAVVRPEDQSVFFTRIELDSTTVYEHQQLVVKQFIFSATDLASYEMAEPKFDGVEVYMEQLSEVRQYTKMVGQDPFLVLEKRYAVFPLGSGTMKLDPVVAGAQQSISRGSFYLPFGGAPKMLRARSRARQIKVLPKPAEAGNDRWLPLENLQLTELWSENPPRFVVGEPITRTLMIKGEGITAAQLPDLRTDTLDGVKQYPDQPALNDIESDSGITGASVQKVALIPVSAGKFELPAIEVPWWNVKTKKREVARIAARTIEVSAGAGAATPSLPNASSNAMPQAEQAQAGSAQPAPPVSAESMLTRVDPGMWPFLTLVMGLGWMMTVVVWLRQNRAAKRDSKTVKRRMATLRQRYKALTQSCKQQDAASCRRDLLAWAELAFAGQRVSTLRDLVSLAPQPMAVELQKIDAVLYGGEQAGIDFDVIRKQARQVMKAGGERPLSEDAVLEPLYK